MEMGKSVILRTNNRSTYHDISEDNEAISFVNVTDIVSLEGTRNYLQLRTRLHILSNTLTSFI